MVGSQKGEELEMDLCWSRWSNVDEKVRMEDVLHIGDGHILIEQTLRNCERCLHRRFIILSDEHISFLYDGGVTVKINIVWCHRVGSLYYMMNIFDSYLRGYDCGNIYRTVYDRNDLSQNNNENILIQSTLDIRKWRFLYQSNLTTWSCFNGVALLKLHVFHHI